MKKSMQWGATPDDWDNLSMVLGYTADLLPVVSNPKAPISELSKIKALGKTPSIYNMLNKVAGFANWTETVTRDEQIAKWKRNKDYGICIQTRYIRAIDVDVKDKKLSKKVRDFICARYKFPVRTRSDSSKFLMAFRVRGDIQKSVIRMDDVKGGPMIEFLAQGQQFVAYGTHPDGQRYEWDWQGLKDFPEITLEEYNELLAELMAEFGNDLVQSHGGVRNARDGEVADADDVIDYLYAQGLVLSDGRNGEVYFDCPWKDGHSSDNGDTQTAYFPPGSRGYQRGHFKCLHAGCQQHDDTAFAAALGVYDDMFEDLGPLPQPELPTVYQGKLREIRDLPNFRRSDKLFKRGIAMIYPELANLRQALERPEVCGVHLRYDTFEGQMMISPLNNPNGWEVMGDGHQVRLRDVLEENSFGAIGRELMRDALTQHAMNHSFDSAQEWLHNIVPQWDGVERIGKFFPEYAGTEDSDYTRAVSRYLWTALAGRVLQPGVKADMVPVLIGAQGVGKSMLVASLVPTPTMAASFSLRNRDTDLARLMKGKLIGELAELVGLRHREREDVKKFISETYDAWIEKYQIGETKRLRRIVFVGTTNEEEFLDDPTGHRRWLPVKLLVELGVEGIKRIQHERMQLWAEARDVFLMEGIDWSAQGLAGAAHAAASQADPWEATIDEWMDIEQEVDEGLTATPRGRGFVQSNEVAEQALGLLAKNCDMRTHLRIAGCLKRMGWGRYDGRINGLRAKWWVTDSKFAELQLYKKKG